ncbi:hypothetical protein WA158_001736 [Blastocystis sp. Blastoise]
MQAIPSILRSISMLRQPTKGLLTSVSSIRSIATSDCIDRTKKLDITPIIEQKLKKQFNATEVHIKDLSEGYNQLLEIRISSPLFKDMSVIQRHRALNSALSEEMKLVHGISFIPTVSEESK